jgi:hypothetical protein
MIVVVVLISSWYWPFKNAWKLPFTAMVTAPWMSQASTNNKQNAKNGARLAICAVTPANRSKKPTRLETSLGIKIAEGDNGGSGTADVVGLLIADTVRTRQPDFVVALGLALQFGVQLGLTDRCRDQQPQLGSRRFAEAGWPCDALLMVRLGDKGDLAARKASFRIVVVVRSGGRCDCRVLRAVADG